MKIHCLPHLCLLLIAVSQFGHGDENEDDELEEQQPQSEQEQEQQHQQQQCGQKEMRQILREEGNKQIVLDFSDALYIQRDHSAIERYLHKDKFHSHDRWHRGGVEELRKRLHKLPKGKTTRSILRLTADGDYVWLHVRATSKMFIKLTGSGNGTMDFVNIYRLNKRGKIVEHWAVSQNVVD